MAVKLSIRSYTFVSSCHAHNYHQLVFPLVGAVDIDTGRHKGRATPGQCIVTLANDEHWFAPAKGSYFLVADIDVLPENMQAMQDSFLKISAPVQTFCFFVQKQLEQRVHPSLEDRIGEWFVQLLGEESFAQTVDVRVARVVEFLERHLSASPSLVELASVACLSLSQLKALFKKETGKTTGQYQLMLRMEKAKALLVHTDYPVSVIANQVGYQDFSAFSHRFTSYFGFPPSKLRSK